VHIVGTQPSGITQGRRVRALRGIVVPLGRLRGVFGWQTVALLLFAIAILGASYQVERPTTIDVGGPHEFGFLQNWHATVAAEDGRTSYRWTDATSFVVLKGLGGGRERQITLRLRSGRPPGVVQPVSVLANGIEIGRVSVGSDWQMAQFDARGATTKARGLVVELRTPVDRVAKAGNQPLGVQIDRVRIESVGGDWTIPAWGTLALALIATLLMYSIAFQAIQALPLGGEPVRSASAVIAGVGVVILGWLLIEARAALAASLSYLVLILAGVCVATLVPPLLVRIGARLGLVVTQAEAVGLGAVLALGTAIKLGGLLYPDTAVIDLAWHVRWERAFLQGDFRSLYFPSDLSSGPKEWGVGVLIPKSPLYYAAMAPFAVLPFGIATGLKLGIGLMEVAMPLFAYLFLKRIGQGTAGIVAAFLYAVTPLSYLALSWGIYPTLFAQFFAVAAFAVVLLAGERLGRPATFTAFVVLLSLSLLAYPVVAVFNVCVLAGVGLWQWRREAERVAKRRALLLPIGAAIASLIAFLAYYVQYVRVTLDSLHTLGGSTAESRGYTDGGLLGAPWHIITVVTKNLNVGNLFILVSLAIVGVVALRRTCESDEHRRAWQLLLAWLLIMPIFTLADAYVDLLLKPLYYTMLPVAIFSGVAVVWLWRRGRLGQALAIVCCLAITAQAWWLWYHRIVYAGQPHT
jgi:hypothetical protein